MKYIIKSIAAYLLCFGIGLSTNADPVDSGLLKTKALYTEECTLTVKTSVIWSAIYGESEVTGPCDKLVERYKEK